MKKDYVNWKKCENDEKKKKDMDLCIVGDCWKFHGALLYNMIWMKAPFAVDAISGYIASGIGSAIGCVIYFKRIEKED